MWIVLKYKRNEFNFLKEGLIKVLGKLPVIFRPKIKFQKLIKNKIKFIENDILEDYLLCYDEKFSKNNILNYIKNLKGLKYVLNNSKNSQKEITDFIEYCKNNQSDDGYIKQSFFNFDQIEKGIFLSGPFTNMFFNVIHKQRNNLKILIGNMTTTIKKNSNYLYRPI
tara:strand:- start:310 stop:810 length:501 start_codon:yes stop_codon:yes gene_type:complete